MAIVLALLIVGWLVAFALGNQAGFENQPVEEATSGQTADAEANASYGESASAA